MKASIMLPKYKSITAGLIAAHRHHNCRKSEDEIAKALVSDKREDYLFGLK
ncbi:MAG: hypothetical protein RIC03_14740 [Cyclobacteriaceae bacterium]